MKRLIGVFMLCALLPVGCVRGPLKVERFVEFTPSETVFVIPLEGATDAQAKTDSVKFLEKAKVNTQRISIPQRQHNYGHYASEYRWIPTVRVIKVNRAPVTREWTAEEHSGTSSRNEGLEVQSQDGVMFSLGATITCRIEEQDTALYLYHYGTIASSPAAGEDLIKTNKDIVHEGRLLSDVIDQNVRSYMQARLFHYFSGAELDEAKKRKIEFFESAFADAKRYFKERGVTIDSFGSTKGLTYANKEVQEAINQKFLVENKKLVVLQEKAQNAQENAKKIGMAKASKDAAEKFLQAKDAMIMSYQLEIDLMRAQARKAMAESWNGTMPRSILPNGQAAQMLLDISDK